MPWLPESTLDLLAAVGGRVLSVGSGILLFTKTNDRPRSRDPLDSKVRRDIMALVQARGAVPLAEIRERVPLGWGTVWHHVRVLVEAGLVRLVPSGRRKIVVPATSELTPEQAQALAVMRGGTTERVARFILANPGCGIGEISGGLALSKRVVYYHVKILHDANLVKGTSPTRYFALSATHLLPALLSDEGK